MESISRRISDLEDQINLKLTTGKLQKTKINFAITPENLGSEMISLAKFPKNLRKSDESTSLNFSRFAMNWKVTNSYVGKKIRVSETGIFQILSVSTGGIYTSLDGGNNFILVNGTDHFIATDLIVSADGVHMSFCGNFGVFISSDLGNSFIPSNFPISDVVTLCMSAEGDIQYSGNLTGVYKSTNYGMNWKLMQTFSGITDVICSSNGQYVTGIGSYIYYSNDYLNNITKSNAPESIWTGIYCSSTGQYQTAINNVFEVYISSNYGVTWNLSYSFYDTITDVAVSGSGKYQLISGTHLYYSKNYGQTWYTQEINSIQITSVSLSSDGKIGMLCSDCIYTSLIPYNFILETGMANFNSLDYCSFGQSWNTPNNLTTLVTEIINYSNGKTAISKSGKYQTICVNGGGVWVSYDFGVTFTKNTYTDINSWQNIGMSNSGELQIAILNGSTIWRSTNYGITWHTINVVSCDWHGISISSSGKYVIICCDNSVLLSTNYGESFNLIRDNFSNINSITMSSEGKYCSLCESNGIIYYSCNYGMRWRASNSTSVAWTCISSSSCGQYQSATIYNGHIYNSDDYGATWFLSNSEGKYWSQICVSNTGQYQISSVNSGSLYISTNFGLDWNLCHNVSLNWYSIAFSGTDQYIIAINNNGILNSIIMSDIPGMVTVNTEFPTNPNAIILISGSQNNTYSYVTNSTKSFNISSSNLDDDGEVSYAILTYGEDIC